VTQTGNAWFTLLTQNTAPLHFDQQYASHAEFGRPLVNSAFTIVLVTGQSVSDISQNVMANLGWDEVRLPTRCSKATLSTRCRKCWRPDSRAVGRTSASKQDGTLVITFRRTVMVYRRGRGPSIPEVAPS
jgi:itaconyl-CoA hydratase